MSETNKKRQGHQQKYEPKKIRAQLKWSEKPWFAALSASSLAMGVVLSFLGILTWNRGAEMQDLSRAAMLPRGEIEFIQISSDGFGGEWKESTRLSAPWVNTGVFEQFKCEDSFCYVDDYFDSQSNATNKLLEEILQASSEKNIARNLFIMSIKNNGGSALIDCEINALMTLASDGGVVLETFSNKINEKFGLKQEKLEQKNFLIGNLEPGEEKIVPLFLEAYFGNKVDPVRVALGRVLLPYAVTCRNVLGDSVSINVDRSLRDAVQYDPFLYGRG